MNSYEFFEGVRDRVRRTGERVGQAAFNHLHEICPSLAASISRTDNDPFYVQNNVLGISGNWERFCEAVELFFDE